MSLVLRSHQEKHVEKIWNLFTKDRIFSCIDTSQTGLGKTMSVLYIGSQLNQKYGTKIMVVAPSDTSLNNDDGWLSNAKKYKIPIEVSTTYSALRGGKGVVSHPWLIPDKEDKKNWRASDKFEQLCSQGLFLVFDEFHHCKNASISHYACAALVRTAKKYRSVCRVALLSHTPGSKAENYPQILRMTGLVTKTKMFKHVAFTSEYEVEKYGLGELKRLCIKLRPDRRQDIEEMLYSISKAKTNVICKRLYDEYIRDIITFAMPKPQEKYTATLLNAFLETDE